MVIGLVSPIAVGQFVDCLYPEFQTRAASLDDSGAPAVTAIGLELLRMGHEVIIFTQDAKSSEYLDLRGDKLRIFVAPKTKRYKVLLHPFFSTYFAIRKILKFYDGKLDVVSTHWTRDHAMASAFFLGKVPVFVTVRDILPHVLKQQKLIYKIPWGVMYMKNHWVMHKKGFHFIANSEYTARMVKKYWNKNIPVIPNPVKLPSSYHDSNIVSEEIGENLFVMTSISSSSITNKLKNNLLLLRVFNILNKKYKNFRLNLVGPYFSSDNPAIQQLQKDGLLDGVNLIGGISHDEIFDVLDHTNLLVHPSLEESFGNILIEAMMSDCPIVGGISSGAVPDILENGKAGYLCDVTDENALIKEIEYIYHHYDDEVHDKVKYARKYCEDKYLVNSIAKKYTDLFLRELTTADIKR